MGADVSKLSQPRDALFSAASPVRFTPHLLDSLETTTESDSTRAADLELHIQRRVEAELRRLDLEHEKTLKDIKAEISTLQAQKAKSANATGDRADRELLDAIAKKDGESERMAHQLSRAGVQKEIKIVRDRLNKRKLKEKVTEDKEIATTRETVIQCLRFNDRRPLDCWQDVEAFKKEVARLETALIASVLD